MIPKMRRKKQQLTLEECQRILEENTAGVLGTHGTEDYPYAVPLSYVYLHSGIGATPATAKKESPCHGSIVFHSAHKGHKIDALSANPHVSFCVVDQDDVIPEEFATNYKSVIVFGTVRFAESPEEKRMLLALLGEKYSPGLDNEMQEEINRFLDATCVAIIDIEHLTGKQSKGLAEKTQ